MNSCEYYQELISRMIDDELSAEESAVLAQHLESCPECSAMYQAFSGISQAIAEDMEEPPEYLRESIMAELRREQIKKENRKKFRWKNVLATAACLAVVVAAAWIVPNSFRMGSAAPQAADNMAPAPAEYAMPESAAAPADSAEYAAAEPRSAEGEAEAESPAAANFSAYDADISDTAAQYVELHGDKAAAFAQLLSGETAELPESAEDARYTVSYELEENTQLAYIRLYGESVFFSPDDAVYCQCSCSSAELEALLFD